MRFIIFCLILVIVIMLFGANVSVSKDWDTVEKTQETANGGDFRSQFSLIKYYSRKGEFDESMKWSLITENNKNITDNQLYELAKWYISDGVGKIKLKTEMIHSKVADYDAAKRIFYRLENSTDCKIVYDIAWLHYMGDYGFRSEIHKVVPMLEKNVEKNDNRSLAALAEIYQFGIIVEKKLDRAKQLYVKYINNNKYIYWKIGPNIADIIENTEVSGENDISLFESLKFAFKKNKDKYSAYLLSIMCGKGVGCPLDLELRDYYLTEAMGGIPGVAEKAEYLAQLEDVTSSGGGGNNAEVFSQYGSGVKGNFFGLSVSEKSGFFAAFGEPEKTSVVVSNIKTGRLVASLPLFGKGKKVDVAFSPDGKTIAISDLTGILLWDYHTAKLVGSFSPIGLVEDISFSPDGKMFVSAGDRLQFWSPVTGKEVCKNESRFFSVSALKFVSDGSSLVLSTRSGHLLTLDIESFQYVEHGKLRFSPHSITMTKMGNVVFFAGNKSWGSLNLDTKELVEWNSSEEIVSLDSNINDNKVLLGYHNGYSVFSYVDTFSTEPLIQAFTYREPDLKLQTSLRMGRNTFFADDKGAVLSILSGMNPMLFGPNGDHLIEYGNSNEATSTLAYSSDGSKIYTGNISEKYGYVETWDADDFTLLDKTVIEDNFMPDKFNLNGDYLIVRKYPSVKVVDLKNKLDIIPATGENETHYFNFGIFGKYLTYSVMDKDTGLTPSFEIRLNEKRGSDESKVHSFNSMQKISEYMNYNKINCQLLAEPYLKINDGFASAQCENNDNTIDFIPKNKITNFVFDLYGNKIVYKFDFLDRLPIYCHEEKGFCFFSYNNNRLGMPDFFGNYQFGLNEKQFKANRLEHFNANNGDFLYPIILNSSGEYSFGVTNSGELAVIGTGSDYECFTGRYSDIKKINGSFSADSKYLAFSQGKNIYVLNIKKKIIKVLIGHLSEVNSLSFSPDGKTLTSSSYDQGAIMWDIVNFKEMVRFVSYKDGEWLSITPEGFFNSSPNGANYLNVRVGIKVYGIDQFYDALYRPDLVKAKLMGDPMGIVAKTAEKINLEKLLAQGSAPRIKFTSHKSGDSSQRDINAEIEIREQGGGVGKVVWKLNGTTVGVVEPARGIKLKGDESLFTSKRLTLSPGENVIEVIAYNQEGGMASDPYTINLNLKDEISENPSLHVIAIGVNKYRDKSLWLNYAVPDTKDFVASILTSGENIFDKIQITELIDKDVSIAGIDAAFDKLSDSANTNDVFVLYMAGHGITMSGKYYFLPVDFRYYNEDSVRDNAITQDHLQKWLAKVPARKSLVLLDTCSSGSFVEAQAVTRGIAEKTAITKLTRATGRATIAASMDSQVALEGYMGHGVFTYVLLESFKRADQENGNRDGILSTMEMASFVGQQVPDLTYDEWGYEQVPQVNLHGREFPIGITVH